MKKNLPTVNYATKVVTQVMGTTLAIAGFHHGFFEFLQGNKPTGGIFINSIGEEQLFWEQGTDPAMTIIPNFLLTGITAMLISVAIMIWSARYVSTSRSVHVLLLLFILLTLFGGGGGHIVFFLTVWGYATRIDKPLTWWNKKLPQWLRNTHGPWRLFLIIASLSFILALEISVFGVPGVEDPDTIFAICWAFLFLSLTMIHFSYITAFAHDLESRKAKPSFL